MLYLPRLSGSASRVYTFLRVFRYITVRTALASLSALFLGLLLGPG